MDELPFPRIESVWSQYDPYKDGHCGGIYVFLLKQFGNAPYLVGETKRFSDRFAAHDKLFATGMRTFFRKPFVDSADDKSHAGFGRRWEDIRQLSQEQREKFLFIPRSSPNLAVADESKSYRKEMAVCIVWKIASTKRGRESLEIRLQNEIGRYYSDIAGHIVDFQIPGTNSLLTGRKQGDPMAAPLIGYSLASNSDVSMSANSFFRSLEFVDLSEH